VLDSKTWLYRPLPSPEKTLTLAKDLRIHPLLATFMVQRGVRDPLEGERFLNPTLESIQSPWMFRDMDVATKRVAKAVIAKEPIGVFGDYDVDGICATVILSDYLSKLGLKVFYKSPYRQKEGYGLSIEGLKKLRGTGLGSW
jgi:single-stranded-DNA-specific exonuclease